MKPKWYHVLGFLWTLPTSILGWILGIILYFSKQIDDVFILKHKLVFCWDLKDSSPFVVKFMQRWYGFSVGNNIFILDEFDSNLTRRSLKHELRHCLQQYVFGVFTGILYLLESLRIWFFCMEKHAYLDNLFEVDARDYAGQPLYIPRSQWVDGPNDRWPWW
jgi:hypothetical protein